ncbi:Two-component system sensor kinase [Cupriavidus taiwanensis]|nr:PAS domain-containing sensor histidine kinase [Cupriavidus taiwanensis]SPA23838.1 Two-component system sensor kinase [Cupriavidus taiwanensis]
MEEAESFLNDYEIPFKGIVEQSVAGIYILQDGRMQYVNETFAAMCNVPRSRMTGELLAKLAAPHQVDALLKQYEKRIRGERPGPFVLHTRRPDGSRGYVEIHGNTVQYRGKPAIVGVGLDVTDRIQKQEELSRSRTQLRELMMRLNSVRERERSTVAQELHDVVGGMLTTIKFDISRLGRRLERQENGEVSPSTSVGTAKETTQQLLELVQESIEAVRRIAEGLRPAALDHLGLQDALAQDLKQFEARYGVSCTFDCNRAPLPLSESRELGLYRIFQEAMTNIARHANASEVVVTLTWDDTAVALEILDNGVGISAPPAKGAHLGLLGMRERARDLNGIAEIGPDPARGFRVLVRIPTESTECSQTETP